VPAHLRRVTADRRCSRPVARLTRTARGGVNKLRFSGRLRGRPLNPGNYRVMFRGHERQRQLRPANPPLQDRGAMIARSPRVTVALLVFAVAALTLPASAGAYAYGPNYNPRRKAEARSA
jgi:hypothetical protein